MDHLRGLSGDMPATDQVVRSGFVDCQAEDAVARLAEALHPGDLSLVVLFLSPQTDVSRLIDEAQKTFAPAQVVGCTTAGELSETGYTEGKIVAIGFPQEYFHTRTILVEDLNAFDPHALIEKMISNRNHMARETPEWESDFTFLLIDGLSTKEDQLTSQLSVGLGPVPFFGGSAGDGTDFGKTFVLHGGKAHSNAAVLIQVRTLCPIKVFKTDHLIPTETRMVVTGADPARRIVHEINAEPAAREYARVLGKDPEQLTAFTFAAHPVVVQIGDQHHVRAIQQVADNGDLVFFSAIDEGVVLTLAEAENMVTHLTREIDEMSSPQTPDIVLACDCILRRLEAQQKQQTREISDILAKNRVLGFSTYGEQINSMHVNQTLTGVAIYPPSVS
ncbi:FIST N-terminal domain-containing protein [Shimia thalassica]|uniref:FIST N-terminal domain-containing protein n=1 Tax=Shimia thalassica TaxID=1715693 RepID=UPI000C07C455|nr:FIST N-terminal domain-containing protein [Shimia thalassica]MDP2581871.1 FIST N-terminal domain-containing protein [Shimia thalassica]PHO05248.1 GfdT protein [Rhodobacteraceae bacterium 4F10]